VAFARMDQDFPMPMSWVHRPAPLMLEAPARLLVEPRIPRPARDNPILTGSPYLLKLLGLAEHRP
jgi:hypothetical protein